LDEDFQVTDFSNGAQGLKFFADGGAADVLLLDWKMPGMDGLEVLRRLRAAEVGVPVILLTVLSDQVYEEAALEGGAVDFIEKSRSFSILLKRLQLITAGVKGGGAKAAAGSDTTRIGLLELKHASKRTLWNEQRIDLTIREFNIVALLVSRAGEDVTYREIYDTVHGAGFVAGYGAEGYRANVRTIIKRIRQRFRDVNESFTAIKNYPGFGYRWDADD
jgi:two-component system response regulator ChvI